LRLALHRFNPKFHGMTILAAGLGMLLVSGAALHAQARNPAPAKPEVLTQVPAGHAGAAPLEVTNGQAAFAGRLAPAQKLRVVLGLRPPKMAEEEAFLVELQTRGSKNFRKFLTPEQWNARFAPAAADEQAVVDWAEANGLTVTRRYANRLIVDVEGTSEAFEKAFAVQMNQYKLNGNVEFSNDHDLVIPGQLAGILHSVTGLNSIQRMHSPHEGNIHNSPIYSSASPSAGGTSHYANGDHAAYEAAMKAAAARTGTDPSLKLPFKSGLGVTVTPNLTNGYIDPTDLYSSYGYDFAALQAQGHCCNPFHVSGGSPAATSIGIATAGDMALSDMQGFQAKYAYLAYYYNTIFIDGTPPCCNDETTLDTEWATATANSFGSYLDTSHVWVYEGANTLLSTFTDIYNQMLSDGHARVFSTSWGCAELACATTTYMDTNHAIFNSMLGQGWTLMAASDDAGATAACDNALRVEYPASDPDMIAVGGTSLALFTDGTFDFETAWSGGHGAGSCSSNDGGSGGGCSAHFAAPGFQSTPYCGTGSRSVPDVSLNAGYGQNYYFSGGLHGVGGTSIATPEVAGFMAQENAYLTAINVGCGTGLLQDCAPIGDANWAMYRDGYNHGYATHYPFYDITSGCNSNDITDLYGLGYYCAASGYDAITGWGSFNALQLSWTISSYYAGSYVNPTVTITGPPVSTASNTWYNTDQTLSWNVTAQPNASAHYPATGVAGYSYSWDQYPYISSTDPASETAQGAGNLFYSGPTYKNASTHSVLLSSAGQGCHYLDVYAWDNTGFTSGDNFYYWICYDPTPPTITVATNPVTSNTTWVNKSVSVTLTPSDPGTGASGVAATYYGVNTVSCYPGNVAGCQVYTAPFTVSAQGQSYVYYWTKDVAGNVSTEPFKWISIDETAPATAASLTGTLFGATYYKAPVTVALSATDTGGSGLSHTYYKLDGGSTVTYSGPFTVSALGSHSVSYWSVDNATNIESAKTASFSITAPAAITAPAPSTMLAGPKVTFTWSAGNGATLYGFRLGTTLGGNEIFATGGTTATSATPANLPTNGSVVYARLTTFFGTTQTYTDYIYIAATASVLTSPKAGTVLAGPKVTFTWSTGNGATLYGFRLGTTLGGNDIFVTGGTTATSATPTNLPTNGSKVYARLTTFFGTNQVYTDYIYTAAP